LEILASISKDSSVNDESSAADRIEVSVVRLIGVNSFFIVYPVCAENSII
jgi:hypothetical protein